MAAASHGRKAGTRKSRHRLSLFYAAIGRQGRKIYGTSKEFEANVVGYPGSMGKAFPSLGKARDWLKQFKCRQRVKRKAAPYPPSSESADLSEDTSENVPSTIPNQDATLMGEIATDSPSVPRQVAQTSDVADLSAAASSFRGTNPRVGTLAGMAVPIYDRMDIEPLGAVVHDYGVTPELISEVTSTLSGQQDSLETLVSRFSEHLSKEQTGVLREVARGKSIFFTGSAGTGKTVVLRAIIAMLTFKYFGRHDEERLAVTASTGISALGVGGATLHSFAGVGLAKGPLITLITKVKNNKKALKRWRDVRTLIVDEISMVDGTLFDKLEEIARCTRVDKRPFGGIQLILCGDFFQLPPVPDHFQDCSLSVCFAFEAASWRRCIQRQMVLTQVFRQSEASFVNILNQMRFGVMNDPETLRHLEREVKYTDGIGPIQLFPLRRQVESGNQARLEALKGPPFTYNAIDQGRFEEGERDDAAHGRRITDLLDKRSSTIRILTFKEGAQVMLTKNLAHGQLVNGSSGKISGFCTLHQAREVNIQSATEILEKSLKKSLEDLAISNRTSTKELKELSRLKDMHTPDAEDVLYPIVQFTNGRKLVMTPLPTHLEDAAGHLEATRIQLPLILAWALSIHKSQGQTLERVKIDLDGTFEAGQAYVAVSRSTGMETLQLLNFNPTIVRAHPRVVEWYKNLTMEVEMDDEEAVQAYFSHF